MIISGSFYWDYFYWDFSIEIISWVGRTFFTMVSVCDRQVLSKLSIPF